jgi:four helix bundle protein
LGTGCWVLDTWVRNLKKTSYRDLEIYQLAHELAVAIHKLSLSLPKYELYETGSQLRRSSKSISANIVEGFGRRKYIADYLRFLIYAQASCDETIEWISYILDCHQDGKESAEGILDELNKLGKKINRFIEAVGKRLSSA